METTSTWVDFTITRGPIRGKDRNRVGLLLNVKTRPDVEEFMAGLAQGRRIQVEAAGDAWVNCNLDATPLEFYDIELPTGGSNGVYTLANIGEAPLIVRNERGLRAGLGIADESVNLSFLRLAGIGNESGVSVGLIGAYSGDYIKRLRNALPGAVKQFLQDFMVPMTISLQVISKS